MTQDSSALTVVDFEDDDYQHSLAKFTDSGLATIIIDREVNRIWPSTTTPDPLTLHTPKAIELLRNYRSLTIVSRSPRSESLRMEILLRDIFDNPSAKEAISTAYIRSLNKNLTFAFLDLKRKSATTQTFFTKEQVLREWSKQTSPPRMLRYLAFDGFVAVAERNPDYYTTARIIANDTRTALEQSLDKLEKSTTSDESYRIRSDIRESVDSMLLRLTLTGSTSDSLRVKSAAWQLYRRDIALRDPEEALQFVKDIARSVTTAEKSCKVTVSASRGINATVKYATPRDAAKGRWTQAPGLSTATIDLGLGHYVFATFRNGKETGRTGVIDCTATSQTVTVEEL